MLTCCLTYGITSIDGFKEAKGPCPPELDPQHLPEEGRLACLECKKTL